MKISVILTVVFSLYAVNAVNANDPTVWKGLSFNNSTVEDAIRIAGKPSKRKVEKMKVVDEIGGKSIGTKDIQVIEFKKIDEWQRVSLGFVEGKLYKAKFWPKNKTIPGSDLPSKYGSDFVVVEGFAKGVPLSVFEGKKEPEVPRVYPPIYYMVSSVSDRHIIATINNGSWKTMWKDSFGLPTIQMFPGWVESVEILSRHGEPK